MDKEQETKKTFDFMLLCVYFLYQFYNNFMDALNQLPYTRTHLKLYLPNAIPRLQLLEL